MFIFQEIIRQNRQKNTSIVSVCGQTQKEKSFQRNLNMQQTSQKDNQDAHQNLVFMPIHTLLSLSNIKKILQKPKTLKEFKQSNQAQKGGQGRSQSIVPLIEPQFLIKTLFEQHSLTLKINQVKYYSTTKKGLRNFQTLQNQDVIMCERVANIFKFFGVFDGHGQYGKLIASTSAGYLKSCLRSYEEQFKRQISEKQIVQVVKNCIKKTQNYLLNTKFNQIQYSGTTALIVLITPNSIVSFNIGNSRLVIGMKEQSSQKIYDFQVTHDHDLNRLDQRLRVKSKGAIISPLKDSLGQNFGPDRLWNKNQKRPGTFITRALGLACGLKAGIISDPQISFLSYNKRMKFLVLASDGLWFVQQNDEVVSYLERYYRQGQLGMGVQSLIEEASTRWKAKSQLMDDISIIGISLSQQ